MALARVVAHCVWTAWLDSLPFSGERLTAFLESRTQKRLWSFANYHDGWETSTVDFDSPEYHELGGGDA